MGGDGGSIPRRIELVRNKPKKEKAGKVAVDAAKWKHCALSQQPLRQPIVACQLGRLYNKEAIIEKLLDESKYTSTVSEHIKMLKDVRVLKLTPTPKELQSHELSSGIIENSAESFCCPIMGQEMNGSYPFVFAWECGCVVSKRAYEAVKDSNCLNCGIPLKPNSIILLNPETENEQQFAHNRLIAFRKACKRTGEKRCHSSGQGYTIKKVKNESALSEENEGKIKSMAPSYTSVQDDPNASSAFKSLFTTSEEALRQPKSHWVTFNPLYFR